MPRRRRPSRRRWRRRTAPARRSKPLPREEPPALPATIFTIPPTGLEQPRSARAEATPGTFAWKLGREFVATVELTPPRGINPAKLLTGARMLQARGIECVDITDSARGRASMSMMAVSTMIRQQVGMEVIIHFTTRDRSLLGIQAELLGAYALGHRIILALTGDPPNPVDKIASFRRVRY